MWAEHYERLLNVEFDWGPDHLSNGPPLEGLPIPITIDMVKKAISKMKSGKAAGPSGIVVGMISHKAAGDTAIIRDGKVPTDCEQSFIVCLYKGKGDQSSRKRRITRIGTHVFSLGRMIFASWEFRVRMFFLVGTR